MLTTVLPEQITSVEEAQKLLTELHRNDESFHPEDDANDIEWDTCDPTPEECEKLNKLMGDIYKLPDFDPCEFILELMKEED